MIFLFFFLKKLFWLFWVQLQCIVEVIERGWSVSAASDQWPVTSDRWQVTDPINLFIFISYIRFFLFMAMVIVSALVERFSFSRMQDFSSSVTNFTTVSSVTSFIVRYEMLILYTTKGNLITKSTNRQIHQPTDQST